jgi:chorismate mutase/prephenate dehydratase
MSARRPSAKSSARLSALRGKIDQLDEKIQKLINERARRAQDIATLKQQSGAANFYRPEREVDVLQRVIARNRGPLPNEEMARLFREIMSACLALEMPMKIAFLGPEGTFTQAAALKHFGHSVSTVPLAGIEEVFREVESGAAHFGVVPIENSTEGVVSHTLDMFMNSPLRICGEVELRIHHHLLGKGKSVKGARRVVASNAEAARLAAKDARAVAIAGSSAAEIYGLNVLVSNIEDEPDNTTRFLIIGRLDPLPTGDDKTSLLISGPNRAGSLMGLLAPLSRHRINMTRIESRPSRRSLWEYVFFVDIDGHVRDARVHKAIAELEKSAAFVKWLGSYPKAVL